MWQIDPKVRKEIEEAVGGRIPEPGTPEFRAFASHLQETNPDLYAALMTSMSAAEPPGIELHSERVLRSFRRRDAVRRLLSQAVYKTTFEGDTVPSRSKIRTIIAMGVILAIVAWVGMSYVSKRGAVPPRAQTRTVSSREQQGQNTKPSGSAVPSPEKEAPPQRNAERPKETSGAPAGTQQGSSSPSGIVPPPPGQDSAGLFGPQGQVVLPGLSQGAAPQQAGTMGTGIMAFAQEGQPQRPQGSIMVFEAPAPQAKPGGPIVVWEETAPSGEQAPGRQGSQGAPPQQAGQPAPAQTAQEGPAASPLRLAPGTMVRARLLVGIAAPLGAPPLPVVAVTDPGPDCGVPGGCPERITWLGQASFQGGERVQVTLSAAVSGGNAFKISAQAVGSDRVPGLQARVSRRTPQAASQIAALAAAAVSDYLKAVSQQGQVTITNGWIQVTQGQAAPFWVYAAGRLADWLAELGKQTQGFVQVAEVAPDTPVTVLIIGAEGGR